MPGATPAGAPPAYLIEPPAGSGSDVEIWGLDPAERLRRSLRGAGCERIARAGAEGPDAPPGSDSVLLFRTDAIYDERLVPALCAARDTVLVARGAGGRTTPVAAHVATAQLPEALALLRGARGAASRQLRAVSARELAPAYTAALRKSAPPYLFHPLRAADARAIEDHLFRAAYKGLTDLVTKWLWPRPAAAVVRALARRGVHPNAVTAASWVLAGLAFWLFARGAFGAGLVAAWLMTFLDTVDGKLARCTLTSSPVGHVFDHALDLIHPPFWWLAWGLALPRTPGIELATAVTVGGYFAGRLLEGAFLWAFKLETHSWRPVDGLFRTITARRNPNLLLLTVATLGGRPDLGLVMVALWTLVSLAFHGVRLLQAAARHRRGERIAPWDEAEMPAARRSQAPTPGGSIA